MNRDRRIAAAVMHCPVGRTHENLERMATLAETAAQRGAGLICFPEMNISGYASREAMAPHAEPVPGAITAALEEMATRFGLTILAGMAETGPGGELFASHVVIRPGEPPGVYRKLHLAPPELPQFTAGKTIPLFTDGDLTFGIQLCYDAHFPELTTHMAVNGVDVIFMPHASPRGNALQKHQSWMRHLPARAYDNGVFVVACNQVGNNGAGLTFPGNAVVIGPSGDIIAENLDGETGLLVVDLKADSLEHVRGHRMRYFLPNRRSDLYRP
jgi:N-carbamoylputrescine amidase